MNSRIDG